MNVTEMVSESGTTYMGWVLVRLGRVVRRCAPISVSQSDLEIISFYYE
jgi:hypothetical protein